MKIISILNRKNLLILFILLYSTAAMSPALAVDSTPSGNIKAKLEEFKKEIASRAAKLKEEVSEKLQNKAYSGLVKDVSDTEITITDKIGSKTVKINQDTVYENLDNPKLKYSFKLVEADDNIAALGEIDELGNLIARKIVLLSAPTPLKTVLWGKVASISDETALIRDRESKNNPVSFTKIDTNAALNDFVIITGYKNKSDILVASFVYIVPQGGVIKSKKVATPSATPKIVPKVTPKPSPALKVASASAKPKTSPTPAVKK